jgi:peroxiredoxin
MRSTRPSRAVRLFNGALVAAPLLAAGAFLFHLGVTAPREARELVSSFRVSTGQPVPSVRLADTLGATTTLAQAVLGQPALVVVMDPECEHCHTEIGTIQRLLARNPGRPAPRVLLVSVGESQRLAQAARRYPGLPLYDDEAGTIRGRLGLRVVPATFVVDAAGRVGDVRVGLQSEEYLAGVLRSLAP